jgi:chromosome segregation ATPase
MSITATLLDCQAINDALRAGVVEQDSLDAQLTESLAALEAYQSHLDAWQQKLSQERAELQNAREQFDRYRTAAEKSSELAAELERVRTHEAELQAAVEEQQRTLERERAHWQSEIQDLRDKLENRGDSAAAATPSGADAALPSAEVPRAAANHRRDQAGSSAVLGSIVEQFGKLRAQRAFDRQGQKNQGKQS